MNIVEDEVVGVFVLASAGYGTTNLCWKNYTDMMAALAELAVAVIVTIVAAFGGVVIVARVKLRQVCVNNRTVGQCSIRLTCQYLRCRVGKRSILELTIWDSQDEKTCLVAKVVTAIVVFV